MKKAILALTLIVCASHAFADSYTDRLVRNYNRHSVTNVSSHYGEYDVRSWCDRKVDVLNQALSAYEVQVNRGHNAAAFAILKTALVNVSQSQIGQDQPLVKLSADSALVVAQKLQQAGLGSDYAALNTLEHLVRNTVTVAYQFDTDYYIEFMYRHHRRYDDCGESFIENMHRQALAFAEGQIGAALKSSVEVSGEVRPKGDPRAFLTVAEVIANNTAYDLRKNIFASEIPCTIVELGELGADLKAFNHGNRSVLGGSVRHAINIAGHELQTAQGNIQNFGGCY